ncbi:hypothetical protein GF325_16725, partial [Candidatus Bathyarchaeota archaeon]|nr:hypothetical protein [Candidatus Bathyarchaeota archaeon]
MLAISLLALGALIAFGALAGISGLMRKKAKNMTVPSRRHNTRSSITRYISERKWGIGLLLLFGVSGVAIGFAANLGISDNGGDDPPIKPPVVPEFKTSGSNPNLTREGYPVTLNRKGIAQMFDPAIRGQGSGARSLWGLGVDEMVVAYYGADNQWHETSFQINEKGYRWVITGDTDYIDSGRRGGYPNGERPTALLEEMLWEPGYVPSRFYPGLETLYFPDGPAANHTGATGGLLPGEAGVMNNWPEFHAAQSLESWGGSPTTTSQVRGCIDYDDELMFLAKNGRKVEQASGIWYRRDLWPNRWEVVIIDPVDGGQSWVYIYFDPTDVATGPVAQADYDTNQVPSALGGKICDSLSYVASGESDQVSFDQAQLKITGSNYQLKVNPNNADQFNDLQITLPGLQPTNIFKQFPKEFVYADAWLYFASCTPYPEINTGLVLKYGAEGQWYAVGAPSTGDPSGGGGNRNEREFNDYTTHVGFFHHRGNPDQTAHPNYRTDVNHGWRDPANGGNRGAAWFDYSSSFPASPNAGDIAIRYRWVDSYGNPSPWGSNQGFHYEDGAMHRYNGASWEPMFLEMEQNVFGDGNYVSRTATIDGPVMAYVERPQALIASITLEMIRDIDADLLDLLADSPADGVVETFVFYEQKDIMVYPNMFELVNNTYPLVQLPPEIHEYDLGSMWHMHAWFKGMQLDDSLPSTTRIYLGGGVGYQDSTWPQFDCMDLFQDDQTWIQNHNFPFFTGIQQIASDNAPVLVDYAPWDWMDQTAYAPAGWWPRTLTINGNEGDDSGQGYTPINTQGSYTQDYHAWWDFNGPDARRRERWLMYASWRDTTVQSYTNPYFPIPDCPETSNVNVIPDWMMVDVPNAGNVWIYQPIQEIQEIMSDYNGVFQPPAGDERDIALFFKDSNDENVHEFGMFAQSLSLGGSVIPFTLRYVFDDFDVTDANDANNKGTKEWVRNRFKLNNVFEASHQEAPPWIVSSFGPTDGSFPFYGASGSVS